MTLTGERLRQLLHSSSVRRKQKKRTNHYSSVTTGEEDREDDEDGEEGKGKLHQENGVADGQFIDCYTITSNGRNTREKWIKPYRQEGVKAWTTTTTSTLVPSELNTYTASVTEDLAFKKLPVRELPVGVKSPRFSSLNVYVFDKELTELIQGKNSKDLHRRTSKRVEETPVRRRKRSDRDAAVYSKIGGDKGIAAPPVPPKPGNLPPLSSSLKYSKTAWVQDDVEVNYGRPNPVKSGREPPLPLQPRKNRPLLTVTSPSEDGSMNAEQGGTRKCTDLDPVAGKCDEEENHYEPVESHPSVRTSMIKSEEGNRESHSVEEGVESDSLLDGKSNDKSFSGSCSDLDDRTVPVGGEFSPIPEQEPDVTSANDSNKDVPVKEILSPTLSVRSEIVLPKLSKERGLEWSDSESGETDIYEAIDLEKKRLNAGGGSLKDSCGYDTIAEDRMGVESDWLIIHRDDIVIVETGEVCHPSESTLTDPEKTPQLTQTNPDSLIDLAAFIGTSLCYDKNGDAVYVPLDRLQIYGDPTSEPWFYPLELSSREATLFLRGEQQEGCFLVYKQSPEFSTAAYNLSLCRGNGDVLHYHILEEPDGGFMIEGHDHSFLNLTDLVEYFKRNKSSLATRLRRPLKEARLPVTAGYHYDLAYELDRNRLSLTGSIIGKGNFGVVCSGVYGTKQVAVKVLQDMELSLQDEDDFIEEARVLMLLKHEHIVKIIGVSSSARPFFLVTEFVPHGNLKECLRNGRISLDNPDVLADICLQMLSALSYLESHNYILHRDVAARNFLVADLECIKLADFGRARLVSDDNYQAPRTEKISIKWAAPEVLIDFRYSTKSDVWAAGVAMWEVYSVGERPYESLSAEQTAVYVTEGGRLARPALCPEDMYAVVRRCWRRSAPSRPSAASLREIILENKRASVYRRNHKKTDGTSSEQNTLTVPRPAAPKSPRTPTIKKKFLDSDASSGKQRLSVIRDVFTTSGFVKESTPSPRKSPCPERVGTSSSSENVSSQSNTPDTTTGQRIRSSFRKLITTKKIRNSTKSKGDYLGNHEKPFAITEL